MTLSLAQILSLPCIGEGNFRRVYLDRDLDTVFKVEYGEGIDLKCNESEVNNLYRLREVSLPDNVKLPAAYLYVTDGVPVVAMQYIDGTKMGDCTCVPGNPEPDHDEACLTEEFQSFMPDFDFSYGNVIRRGNFFYLVDLDCDID